MAGRGDFYQGIDPNAAGATLDARPVGRPVGNANPFLGAPVRFQGGQQYNPLLDPTGGFARSTKLGGLLSGLFGNGMTRQEFQQQQANTLQAQAMQFVADRAQKVGAQPAILSLIQSDLGQQLMVSGGNFDSIAEVANLAASGKVREARAKAFGQGQAPQATAQPAAVEGDQWSGMRSAGEAVPAPVVTAKPETLIGDAGHYVSIATDLYSSGDETGGDQALKLANQALAIENARKETTPDAVKRYMFYRRQRESAGAEPLDYFDWELAQKKASATNITNTIGGENESELMKQLAKTTGEEWGKLQVQGRKAAGVKQDLEALGALLSEAPQGTLWGREIGLGNFQGLKLSTPALASFTTAGQAFESIVKRIAPSLREPGSGSTSDMEVAMFLDSLPNLKNTPIANILILRMLQAKAALDIERSGIIDMAATGEITTTEARMRLNEINSRSIMTNELRAAMAAVARQTDPVSRERRRGPDAGSVGGGRGGGGGGGGGGY